MLQRLRILTITLLLPWLTVDAQPLDNQHDHVTEQDTDEEHDHHDRPRQNEDEHDSRDIPAAPVDDTDHADSHDHLAELAVELTPEAVEIAGLTISTATCGRIATTVELLGEVGFNEDQLVHIAPRFAGIAQQARYRVGDYVEAGHVMAIVESNESMNPYTITAPISGWVIKRHISTGEFVSEENSIYVVADLSLVWVDLAVYPKDFDRVRKGQVVQIKAVGTMNSTTGTIDYIAPIIDSRTRSATARITLPNPDNTWRPGTFVHGTITTEGQQESLVVRREAVQRLGDRSVVFIVDGPNRFRPVDVVTGDSDDGLTQIVNGLSEGTKYVSNGAFELKAKIVTSNLDAHAGHGH